MKLCLRNKLSGLVFRRKKSRKSPRALYTHKNNLTNTPQKMFYMYTNYLGSGYTHKNSTLTLVMFCLFSVFYNHTQEDYNINVQSELTVVVTYVPPASEGTWAAIGVAKAFPRFYNGPAGWRPRAERIRPTGFGMGGRRG